MTTGTGHDFLLPSPPPNAVPPSAPPRRNGRWIVIGALVAVATLLAALVGVGIVASEKTYPANWDARLGDLPATVERLRGLRFDHPVPVRFLDEKAFRREMVRRALAALETEIEGQTVFR